MQFIVRSSSSGEEYEIRVFQGTAGVGIACTCMAGSNGQICKHRLALISGDSTAVIRASHSVDDLTAMLDGGTIAAALAQMRAQEAVVAREQAKLKALKKVAARAMLGV